MKKIIAIEDEEDLAELIEITLSRAGFEIETYRDGIEGIKAIKKDFPHLVILDMLLPQKNGHEILKEIRNTPEITNTPVIFLTALNNKEDRIKGLEGGADDYLTKPFYPEELILRIHSILKRTQPEKEALRFSNLLLKKDPLELSIDSKNIPLTLIEFKLLLHFFKNPNLIHSRKILFELLGYSPNMRSRTLDVHLTKIRSKLGNYASCLKTIRSKGYQFIPPV